MFLKNSIIGHGKLLCLLVVPDDDGGVPLRGALHPIHLDPVADEVLVLGVQDVLTLPLLGPPADRTLAPVAHGQPGD